MASQNLVTNMKKVTRHRLREITLDPATSAYDIIIALFVDETRVHKLQRVQKGQTLRWADMSLPCDVHENSTLTVQITEIHKIRDRAESYTCQMSQVIGQGGCSVARGGGKYTVKLGFLTSEMVEHAYQDAFAKARQIENQTGMPDRTGKARAAFKALLTLGNTVAELDPSGGAKVTFVACTKAWELLEEQDKQDQDINKLVEDLARTIPSVESVKRLANANLGEIVTDMLNLIEDVSLFIMRSYSRSSRTRMFSISAFDSGVQDQTQGFVARFRSLREEFDTRVAAQTLETMHIEMIRSRLKPVDQAGYDPTWACMPDTRVTIIHDITAWVEGSNRGRQLAWVHGLAGLGKSSIASSICKQLDERGTLAASFFCKRDNPELRDPHRLLTSIAYQLAMRWKPYGEAVVAVAKADPEVCSQHIQPLCDALLVKPLQAIAEPDQPDGVLTIVVDALDECGGTDTHKQLITCLQKISHSTSWLRLVVTSRPDVDIQDSFAQLGSDWHTPYNVLIYDALADIRVFIRNRLCSIERDVEDWPKDAVDRLCERSSGLFIWARTACELITQGHNPSRRLEQVLASRRAGDSSAELDTLYTTAVKAGAIDEDEEEMADVLSCLGVVVVTATRTPLPIASLARLLRGRMSQYTIDHVFRRLSSVLYLDRKRGDAVRICHPSFMDYIVDRSRSKELCVDLEKQNTLLAECCLETMTKELQFNICKLETSHLLNREVPDLEMRVQNAIGSHLSYSCVYWTGHLVAARKEVVEGPLRVFLFGLEFLYWIEALSLLGKLNTGLSSLLELHRVSDIADACRAYAHDAYRFVLSFYDAISESTPHLYTSALGLAPEVSKVAQHFRRHFSNTFTITEGTEQEWTPYLRTIQTGNPIFATTFSPDGRRVATGSSDGAVMIWDAETGGALLEPLRGHWGRVWSVAFSPDSRRIVSGSTDGTVQVWDARTGAAILALQVHSGGIRSIAFSPDGHRLISGCGDYTVRIWDARTGAALLDPLEGHSNIVLSIALSPDGHRIASGSADYTIRVWSADTGAPALEPLLGHLDEVCAVVFSFNGDRIVSASSDKTIRIWDAVTGAALLEPLRGHSSSVFSVALSPDSRFIFSGSDDDTVRIWSAETGSALSEPLRGHSSSVWSVACSPDGHRVISGSYDKTLRIWDTDMRDIEMRDVESNLPQGHSDQVMCVAFSPNGHWMVSGSHDEAVRVWDAKTGDAVLEPLLGHSGVVSCVAFSPHGSRIASGSSDNTVRVWDAETGAALLTLQGHSDAVTSVAFSFDGGRIVSGSCDKTLQLRDAETGAALLEPLRGHSVWVSSVAFSPNGHRIVSGSGDKTIRIWDAKTGIAVLEPLQGHSDSVWSVAFSLDGHRIVSGSADGTARVWDAETGAALLEPLRGPMNSVNSVAFSPNSRHIVLGSDDMTVRVWDAETGIMLLEPMCGHWLGYDTPPNINSVAFSPDGRYIISGASDSTIRIWDIDTCAETNPHTLRLPGTWIPTVSACAKSQPTSTSSILARYSNSNGWVMTSEGGLFIWLPPELRAIDDSSICISTTYSRRRVVMDFSKFVHGGSWSSVTSM